MSKHVNAVFDFTSARYFRRMRFEKFKSRERAYDAISRQLQGYQRGRPRIVIMVSACFASTMKGTKPVPTPRGVPLLVTALRKRGLQIIMQDEYNTSSKVCPNCLSELQHKYRGEQKIYGG